MNNFYLLYEQLHDLYILIQGSSLAAGLTVSNRKLLSEMNETTLEPQKLQS